MKRNLFWSTICLMGEFLFPQIVDAALGLCHPYSAALRTTYSNPCTIVRTSYDLVQAECPSLGQVDTVHITVMPICSGSASSHATTIPAGYDSQRMARYCWCARIEPTLSQPVYSSKEFTDGVECLNECYGFCADLLTRTASAAVGARQYLLGTVVMF
ncbi:MAG: hypothetical protein IJD41_00035 [Alphaproteobacteria bacterium]|nr:hypothetical protein [Alphaproteobacteria bacterium]